MLSISPFLVFFLGMESGSKVILPALIKEAVISICSPFHKIHIQVETVALGIILLSKFATATTSTACSLFTCRVLGHVQKHWR